MPPLFSTITLLAEIVISCIVFLSIYQGYFNNKFPVKLVTFALLYETIFNISYMVSKAINHVKVEKISPPSIIALAIIHGTLSLIMFISLVIFFILAWKGYKKGINFFKEHKKTTTTFLIFWTLSVSSGIIFYFVEYFLS
jgi:hypothetical protein